MGMRKWLVLSAVLVMLAGSCWAVPVTSPFGWRVHPITGQYKFHTGVDLGYEYGEAVRAVMPGRVVYCYWWGGYGNCVILAHANGDHTLYGHMSRIDVSYGQEVARGQSLGRIGSTGLSTGPHLHLEWWHNGSYMDPMGFFYAGKIQDIEFYAARESRSFTGGETIPPPPVLPESQGDLQVPDSQKELVRAQLSERFVYKAKEKPESVFFE